MYYPGAFTAEGLAAIHQRVAPAERIALGRADAERFAANAVHLERRHRDVEREPRCCAGSSRRAATG